MATKLKDHSAPAAPANGPAQADDFAAWAFHQAALLRSGQFHLLNAAEIAEELDGLGRGEFNDLVSQLRIVLLHLLKWDHQPSRRSRSWAASVAEHRVRIATVLEDNPSLKPRREHAVQRAYQQARLSAARETRLHEHEFPEACPYDWEVITARPITFETR
ncbi:MAG: DUF29 domain-containing protein [Sandarakinorhabdus sp.]|jgi:hypothetical protein